MTDPKGDMLKLIMGRTAVERLIGNDASTEVILTDQAVRSFIGKHLTRLETIIRSQAESITKEMLETTVTQLLGKVETLRDGKRYIPSADMAETITRMLEPLVDKRLREIVTDNMQDIDAKIANVAEAYVVGEIDKRVKMLIDNAVKLAQAARVNKPVKPLRVVPFKDDRSQDKSARQMAYDMAENASPEESAAARAENAAWLKTEADTQAEEATSWPQPAATVAEPQKTWRLIAEDAYEAYVAVMEGKNFRDDDVPDFVELPTQVQAAWEAAVRHAADSARTPKYLDAIVWAGWRPPTIPSQTTAAVLDKMAADAWADVEARTPSQVTAVASQQQQEAEADRLQREKYSASPEAEMYNEMVRKARQKYEEDYGTRQGVQGVIRPPV